MKKFLFLLFALISMNGYAQFVLTTEGFINDGTNKNFFVYNFDGRSANDLYTQAMIAVTSLYHSSNTVANKVEGEIININGSGTIQVKRLMTFDYTMDYNLIIKFKDGRIRFDAPIISEIYTYNGYGQKNVIALKGSNIKDLGTSVHIFNKNGKLKEPKIKSDIETYFNRMISEIISSIESNAGNDEW